MIIAVVAALYTRSNDLTVDLAVALIDLFIICKTSKYLDVCILLDRPSEGTEDWGGVINNSVLTYSTSECTIKPQSGLL